LLDLKVRVSPVFLLLPFPYVPGAVIAVVANAPIHQLGEQTGIIYGCFRFNNMSTYEESCSFASLSSTAEILIGTTSDERFMKTATLISLAAVVLLTSRGFAAPYDELAAKGYRWVNTNGPYACPSKDDLRRITKRRTDDAEVEMIEQLRAYYLIEGAVVQVVMEDAASGMSQIHSAGIGPDVWTLTKFLSKHPVRNTDGEIEVPLRNLTPRT
jgi:hypothetical protein